MWPRALRHKPGPKIPLSPADVPETVQAQQQLDIFHRRFVAAGILRVVTGVALYLILVFADDLRWSVLVFAIDLGLFSYACMEMGRAEMAKSLQKVILEASRRQDEGIANVVEAMTRTIEEEEP